MGASRSVKVRKARFLKGRRAALKIAGLVRTSPKSSKLYLSNAFPKAVWAPEVHGLAPSMVKQLRGQARLSSKCPQRGSCATTAIRISLGSSRDPAIMYIRRLVGA
eukprot:1674312-Pyramimonas_sp.AAC.1